MTVKCQHTDALGSVVAETDSSGAISKRNAYAPYGEEYTAGTKVIDGQGYTGHVMDLATGFTQMQQRSYDPVIGRFLSVDPAASEFNRYNYANNNPYKFTDPDGRRPRPDRGAANVGDGMSGVRSDGTNVKRDDASASSNSTSSGQTKLTNTEPLIVPEAVPLVAGAAASGASTGALAAKGASHLTGLPQQASTLKAVSKVASKGALALSLPFSIEEMVNGATTADQLHGLLNTGLGIAGEVAPILNIGIVPYGLVDAYVQTKSFIDPDTGEITHGWEGRLNWAWDQVEP